LVVDDDEFVLKLLTVALSRAGHKVFTASDGSQALSQVNGIQPDLIILDVGMPGMNGYEVCEKLRRRPKFAHLPIIMLTANDTLEQKLKGFEAGTDDYMVKPFQPAELEARVQVLLQRSTVLETQAAPIEGQITAVFSLRGGAGVSTIATNLALGLVHTWGLPTTLVDMVFTCGQDALMLNLALHATWADLAEAALEDLDRDAVMQALLLHSTDLQVLAAPPTPEQGDLVKAELISGTLELLAESNHYLVLDLPHDFQERTLIGLDRAHKIVAVMTPDIASVYGMKRTLEVFSSLGYDPSVVSLVLNQTFERRAVPQEAIEDTLGRAVNFVIPFASEQLVDAINRGIPPVARSPESRLGTVFRDMAFDLSKEEHRTEPSEEPAPALEQITRQLQQYQQA
jgi:pilus assembly protein CpaE